MADVVLQGKKYTEEEMLKGLAALQRQREQSRRWREKAKSPEYKAKMRESNTRRRITQNLLIAKAKAAGIKITNEEIEKLMASTKTRKK